MTLISIIGVPFRHFWKFQFRTCRGAIPALLEVLFRHFYGGQGNAVPSLFLPEKCGFGTSYGFGSLRLRVPTCGLVFRVHKGGTAALGLAVVHQGQIDLVGVPPATPLFPDQPGGGQLLHGLNDLAVADLRFLRQGAAGVDDEYRPVLVDPAVEPGELETVEQEGIGYLGLQSQPHIPGVGEQPAGHLEVVYILNVPLLHQGE